MVTGGSSGIGLAIAKRLINDGAKVVITGRNAEKLNQAVVALGDNASGIVTDVSRRARVHPKPDSQKVEELAAMAAIKCFSLSSSGGHQKTDSPLKNSERVKVMWMNR